MHLCEESGRVGSGEACVWSHKMTSHLHRDRKREEQQQQEVFHMAACVGSDGPSWIFLGFFSFFLFFLFATVSLECQCDCWLLISSKTGNGFARSLLLHSRRLTTTRLFLFEWKWHESEDESVSLKNWEDSKWLEGAWHRMCREALLFLLPVSFTSSLQEVITFLPQRPLISSHGALILHLFTQQTQWWVILEGTTLKSILISRFKYFRFYDCWQLSCQPAIEQRNESHPVSSAALSKI